MIASYYKYWGKVAKAEEGKAIRYHFLLYDCLDVVVMLCEDAH